MPNSPRMLWPYPAENQDPWFDAFENMVVAMDSSVHAAREDRNIWMGGGGTVSFNSGTGELSWTEPFEIYTTEVGFIHTIPAGSVLLEDGELIYVNVVRRPTTNLVVAPTVASQVPSSDSAIAIALRRAESVYFRFGSKIDAGESFNIFQGGGGGGGGGGGSSSDTYERSATVTLPDGTSTSQTLTLGRITYPGSIIGLSVDLTEPVNSGSVVVTVKRNGVTTLVATLDITEPTSAQITAPTGTHSVVSNDLITVEVTPASYDNLANLTAGLTIDVTFSTGVSLAPSSIPDASSSQKGLTRLSVAPVSAVNPIAVGTNDTRVATLIRIGTDAILQNPNDTVRIGKLRLDQSTSFDNYLQAHAGGSAAVSLSNTGRIRYNETTQKWQFSENGSAYQDFGSGSGSGWTRTVTVVHPTIDTDTVRIGTGTEAPAFPSKVHIIDDAEAGLTVKAGATGGAEIQIFANGIDDGQIGTNSNHDLWLYTNQTLHWVITTAGDLTTDRNLQAARTSIFDFSVEPGGAGTNGNYLAGGAGSAAAVSAANTGRIRYNQSTQKWQISENGGAYQDFGGNSGWARTGTDVTILNANDITHVGELRLDQSTTSDNHLQANAGSAAGVSPASTGRIRYNESTQKWQVSENGGAYANIASGTISTVDTYERTASFGVSPGASTQEASVGRVIYAGSLVGVTVSMDAGRTAGTVTVNVKVNTVTKLTAVIDATNSSWHIDTDPAGTHAVIAGDLITVEVIADASYNNLAAATTGAVVAVALQRS